MCQELQHMEMLPGTFNEDDGKCTLLSNTRSQSDVHLDTYERDKAHSIGENYVLQFMYTQIHLGSY